MTALRLIAIGAALGVGIDVLPSIFVLALESGDLWISVAGIAFHTLALGLSIWYVSNGWLRESPRTRLLLSLLAVLQLPGAILFGVIFTVRHHQLAGQGG